MTYIIVTDNNDIIALDGWKTYVPFTILPLTLAYIGMVLCLLLFATFVHTMQCLISVPPKIRLNYGFLWGHALIRGGGTIAINTPFVKGARLLGIGTNFLSSFQTK